MWSSVYAWAGPGAAHCSHHQDAEQSHSAQHLCDQLCLLLSRRWRATGISFSSILGHPGPRWCTEKVKLIATGTTLGFLPEIDLHRDYAHLESGAVLVLYSDGITKRQNEEGDVRCRAADRMDR